MRSRRLHTFAIALFALAVTTAPSAADSIAANGDASISHDETARTWTLHAGGATLSLALDRSRDFGVLALTSPSGRVWVNGGAADTSVRLGGRTLPFGSRADGFLLENAAVTTHGGTLELAATFSLAAANLTLTRHYAVVSGSPSFEAWTTYAASGPSTVADLNALQLTIPPGTIHWVTGLLGDSAGEPDDLASNAAFTRKEQSLAVGGRLDFGAVHRASEQTVPWFAVDGASAATAAAASSGTQEQFFVALMWSGAWAASFERTASALSVMIGLAPVTTAVPSTVDGPHVVFGVAPGGPAATAAALGAYVSTGIRGGRPIVPLVTYNTWFAYGTSIDEESMRAEMDREAALGVERFVVDAGWYPGTGVAGPYDFDAGLGAWTADTARFPGGLRPLRDHAHALGMQFGLWVEPERVNLALVGGDGVDERWLATSGGDYGSDHAAQICLAGTAARAWLLDHLSALIDEVQPDYLKWDNNMSITCDRTGHGHGAADGNFAHTNGLYDLLSSLRERYPDLLIENVSGGGNRLDIGMLRFTDAAWMDDRTAPSVHVRHNLEGLTAVFAPAYLLSFVTDHSDGGEPLHDAPDLSLYFRSRMAGALGLCFRSDGLTEGDQQAIAREIDIYKALRGTLSTAAGSLLTAQADTAQPSAWDALQERDATGDAIVVAAFQSDDGVSRWTWAPSALDPEASYQVESVDTGLLGTATGAELMASGIELVQSPNSAAHILIITRQ